MCGRYELHTHPAAMALAFGIPIPPEIEPRRGGADAEGARAHGWPALLLKRRAGGANVCQCGRVRTWRNPMPSANRARTANGQEVNAGTAAAEMKNDQVPGPPSRLVPVSGSWDRQVSATPTGLVPTLVHTSLLAPVLVAPRMSHCAKRSPETCGLDPVCHNCTSIAPGTMLPLASVPAVKSLTRTSGSVLR